VPEGDVVWYTARRLHEALAGRVLTRSDFRVPRFATANLAGQLVTEAVPRGKHLLIRTGNGLTIHTHLKMEGVWRVRPASEGLRYAQSHTIRLLLANAEWVAAGYQLGITEILRTEHEDQVVGHLGPDLLDPDWGEAQLSEAVRRLAAEKERPIGEALLDQRNLAGIGNLYKSEVLFLRGISPWRPTAEIPDTGLEPLVTLARKLLDANKARIGQITTGLAGGSGKGNSTWVYGRRGSPCRRCGTPVRKQPDGTDRVTFWCPACQR
jgi:DNA-formamidopyrimidine glycosylase